MAFPNKTSFLCNAFSSWPWKHGLMQMQNIQRITLNSVWCIIHSPESSFKCTPRSSFPRSLLDLLYYIHQFRGQVNEGHLLSWSGLYMHGEGVVDRATSQKECERWPPSDREEKKHWLLGKRIPDSEPCKPKSEHAPCYLGRAKKSI